MALLGISARLVDGTRGRVRVEGEGRWKRLRSRYVRSHRILSSSFSLSVAYRVAGLYQELSFDAMCSSFFFPKSPLLNYTAGKGGGRHSPRYGFIAVRGNVGIIRVHVVHQLLRDNGKVEKWTFSLKFLHVVGFCV